MKIPSHGMVSAMALSNLQAMDPIIFENSFQTLTVSSLSWIDDGLSTQMEKLSPKNNIATEGSSSIELSASSSGPTDNEDQHHHYRVVAEALIRRIVHKILVKYCDVSPPQQVEEALKYHNLPERLKCELVTKYGGSPPTTWFDALNQLQKLCDDEIHSADQKSIDVSKDNVLRKVSLWELVLDHPITSYVPVQCQSCGRHMIPDCSSSSESDDAELGLREEEPWPKEAPLVRTGWFRGPRMVPSIFVLDCPKCGAVSRWYRSRDPQIILNPQRWGRLCGEQEDLRLDLANYFGFVSIRTIVPLDWDHIWSEFRIIDEDGDGYCDRDSNDHITRNWKLKDDDRNFAARLDEGIGCWTRVLAVSPNPQFCGDVTNNYLACECEGGLASDEIKQFMNRYRHQVTETRRDYSGMLTQAGTLNGYAIQRAGLSSSEITLIVRRAAKEYGSRDWHEMV